MTKWKTKAKRASTDVDKQSRSFNDEAGATRSTLPSKGGDPAVQTSDLQPKAKAKPKAERSRLKGDAGVVQSTENQSEFSATGLRTANALEADDADDVPLKPMAKRPSAAVKAQRTTVKDDVGTAQPSTNGDLAPSIAVFQ